MREINQQGYPHPKRITCPIPGKKHIQSGGFLKRVPKCHHGFHYEKEVKCWTISDISGYLHDLQLWPFKSYNWL